MTMQYKLLNNGTGVILSRQPFIAEGAVTLCFENAPDNATAIVKMASGAICYRPTSACSIPASALEGVSEVTVVMLGQNAPDYRKWICEGLQGKKCAAGMLIAPDDMDLPATVVALAQELHDVREEQQILHGKYDALEKRLASMMEGYDLT